MLTSGCSCGAAGSQGLCSREQVAQPPGHLFAAPLNPRPAPETCELFPGRKAPSKQHLEGPCHGPTSLGFPWTTRGDSIAAPDVHSRSSMHPRVGRVGMG